jgi:STE24 endopeptidase
MLPVTFLLALFVAFGIDPPGTGVAPSDVGLRLLETGAGIFLVAILSLGLGLWVASRVSHDGSPTSRLRRRYANGTRLLSALSLLIYGWIIHSVGWPLVVRANWGLEGFGLLNDIFILLPFLVIQLLIWWGQFFAERALQLRAASGISGGLGRYLLLRSRQSLGLILPVILLFVIRRDILRRLWPTWDGDPIAEAIEMVVSGALVLMAAPVFIRLAWPTRSLPDGPLRRRLERVARRAGFRFADVLIWDTSGSVLNACVTGIVPGFRYVLLTDALVDTLTPDEVAAVFGHEIGHIAHRHLLYFGFFFAGSLGLLTLLADAIARGFGWMATVPWRPTWISPEAGQLAEESAVLLLIGLYFWLVFGYLSRRFERQADVFGSKVVSCERTDCPPHLDPEAEPGPGRRRRLPLCRMGLRTFSEALTVVAQCNGIELGRPSWRHGSIAYRIRFLRDLEHNRAGERRFQREVLRLRIGLGVVMVAAMLAVALKQVAP